MNMSGLTKRLIGQIDDIGFMASIITLPLSIKWSSKLLFMSILLRFFRMVSKKDFSWYSNQKPVITFYTLLVFYIIIQGIWLDGSWLFFKTFDKAYAPYLIFLLVPLFYNNIKIVAQIPKALILGVGILMLFILVLTLVEWQWYDREMILEVFDIHHLYISLYLLFIMNYILSSNDVFKLKSRSLLLLMVILFLLLFRSKAAIVTALALMLFHSGIWLKLSFKKLIGLGFVIAILIVIFHTFFFELYLKALDFRSRIWNVAIESIMQQPLLGYGNINEYDILNTGHFLNGNYDFLDSHLNAHNQFLTSLLKFGLVGFILMFIPYSYPLLKGKNSIRYEYIGFLIVMIPMSFVESFFNRHHGIVFFCITLYYYHTMSKKVELKA
ncbi:O-antigen ligase family protein [Aestuariivivens sediminicola]|uniref:O-antigen ligase family protein n=1 Tax=Aestuariivivens sediminicola TaxID=2913560 RepID=UPI001F5684B1|nr:O-antigen ligase family protein [Aestuariivivens sediminicola]